MMTLQGLFEIGRSAFADPSHFVPTGAPDLMSGVFAAYLFAVMLGVAVSPLAVAKVQVVIASVTSIVAVVVATEIAAQAKDSKPRPAFVAELKLWAAAAYAENAGQLAY